MRVGKTRLPRAVAEMARNEVLNAPRWLACRRYGDFDGDGKSDLLWRTDSGALAIWEMNGTQIISADYTKLGSAMWAPPARIGTCFSITTIWLSTDVEIPARVAPIHWRPSPG